MQSEYLVSKLRQENLRFKAGHGYMARLRPTGLPNRVMERQRRKERRKRSRKREKKEKKWKSS